MVGATGSVCACVSVLYLLFHPHGYTIPMGRAILGVFFPTDTALYSIAFGTHKKTAELIEMPFGLITWLGPMLNGGPNPPKKMGQFWRKAQWPIVK